MKQFFITHSKSIARLLGIAIAMVIIVSFFDSAKAAKIQERFKTIQDIQNHSEDIVFAVSEAKASVQSSNEIIQILENLDSRSVVKLKVVQNFVINLLDELLVKSMEFKVITDENFEEYEIYNKCILETNNRENCLTLTKKEVVSNFNSRLVAVNGEVVDFNKRMDKVIAYVQPLKYDSDLDWQVIDKIFSY